MSSLESTSLFPGLPGAESSQALSPDRRSSRNVVDGSCCDIDLWPIVCPLRAIGKEISNIETNTAQRCHFSRGAWRTVGTGNFAGKAIHLNCFFNNSLLSRMPEK